MKALSAARTDDIRRQQSTKGPHRDDVEFLIEGKDARNFGSQGQIRTVVLALKMAEVLLSEEILGEKLLELDAADAADARFTLALAYAKLEDEDALDNLMDQYRKLDPPRGADDPWILLARLAIHFKKRELVEAEHYLDLLIERYPEATLCCFVQKDYLRITTWKFFIGIGIIEKVLL